jgi:hypothetical protein
MTIVRRLLVAFLVVSLLPIGVFAYLSSLEGEGEEAHAEELLGLPLATIELLVAGITLALSVAVALFLGRTLVRPLRRLEGSMRRVSPASRARSSARAAS